MLLKCLWRAQSRVCLSERRLVRRDALLHTASTTQNTVIVLTGKTLIFQTVSTFANNNATFRDTTGATATGKSSAAEYLCTQYQHHNLNNYEIVVADSVQAMRHLNIGANKPSQQVMSAIPHHMVSIHEPGVLYSAGEYCVQAKEVVVDIMKRGRVPLIVGGNTMWVDWLINGVPNAPKGSSAVKLQAALLLAPFMSDSAVMRDDDIGVSGDTSACNGGVGGDSSRKEQHFTLADWEGAVKEVMIRKQALLAAGPLPHDVSSSVQMSPAPNDWYRLHRLLEIILSLQHDVDAAAHAQTAQTAQRAQQTTAAAAAAAAAVAGDSEHSGPVIHRNDGSMEGNSDSHESVQPAHDGVSRPVRFRGLVQEVKSSLGIDVDLRCFFLGGERMSLYKSIDRRCVAMLEEGLLEEVAELYCQRHIEQLPQQTSGHAGRKKVVTTADNCNPSQSSSSPAVASPSSQSSSPTASAAIGYRQSLDFLCREDKNSQDFSALIKFIGLFATATRNYAKRQLHWYRNDSNFLWIHDTSCMFSHKRSSSEAAKRLAQEIHHWTYDVNREEFVGVLERQFCQARDFARSNEMRVSMHSSRILKEIFNASVGRSGEDYVLRSCEGAMDRASLRKYTSQFMLSPRLLNSLCSTAKLCRVKMRLK